MPVLSKEFLDIQVIIEFHLDNYSRLTLNRLRDMMATYSQIQRASILKAAQSFKLASLAK